MKNHVVACLALLAWADAAAAFDGRVVDARTGAPLAGVHVTIVGHTGSAMTDRDGRFAWRPDPRPPFDVIVMLQGGRMTQPVRVQALPTSPGVPLVVAVSELLHEQVLVAGVAPHLDVAPGAGMTLVTGEHIAARSPATLAQALEDVAGASATSDGQAAVPTLRGLARGRTLILIDGGRVTAERRAGPSASFLDPGLIASIVVARGPVSVAYGTDALGGVIAVRTRGPVDRAPLAVAFSGTVGAGIPERRALLQIAKGFSRGGVLAAAHARKSDDYQGPDGRVGNSRWQDGGLFLRTEQAAGPGRLSVVAQYDQGEDLGRPRSDLAAVRVFAPFERSTRLSASYDVARLAGIEQIRIDGAAARAHERAEQDRARAGNRPRVVDRATLGVRDAQLRVRGGRAVRGASLEFGVDVSSRYGLTVDEATITYTLAGALASVRESASIASASRTIAGSFLQAQMPASSRVTLAAGARLDHVRAVNTGGYFGDRRRTDGAGAGFGAVTLLAAPGLSVTARASRGFRDATLSDRFHRGPAGRGFVTGNPGLEPETSRQYDLTAIYSHRRLHLSAGLYHYRIRDLIEVYATAPDQSGFRNRGRARLRGAELEAAAPLGRGWTIAMAAHTSDGRALDDGAALNDIAPATVSATLRGIVARRFGVHGRVAAVVRDGRPGPSEVTAPDYRDVGAGATMRAGRHVELRAAARNLLNDRYYASPGMRWVHAPGRSGSFTVVVR